MGRIRRSIAILIISLFWPVQVMAEMLVLPNWKRVETVQRVMACYSFETAKELKLIDSECELNKRKVKTSLNLLSLAETRIDIQTKIISKQEEILVKTESHVSLLDVDNDRLREERDSALKRDIFGGALPWLIAIGVGVFAGGVVVGVAAATK